MLRYKKTYQEGLRAEADSSARFKPARLTPASND